MCASGIKTDVLIHVNWCTKKNLVYFLDCKVHLISHMHMILNILVKKKTDKLLQFV